MILSLVQFALLQAATPASDYVPDTGWRDNQWAQTFNERWFGGQLRAMNEPTLAGQADLAGYRERFRLLVLPSFAPGYAYRLDVRQDGTAVLHWTLLNGRGGYAPGIVARQGSRSLRASELAAWRRAIDGAALPALRREEEDGGPAADANGDQSVSICVDGPRFVFEHLSTHGRDYVVRGCEIEGQLQRLAHVIYRMQPRNRMN